MDDAVMMTEGTTPVTETATPAETEAQTESAAEDTTPAEGTESADTQAETQTDADSGSLEVKYNHQIRSLTKDEAAKYAQMGLAYEAQADTRSKLDFLAAVGGKRNAKELVDSLYQAHEEKIIAQAKEKADGDPDLEKSLIEAMRLQSKSAYDRLLQTRQDDDKRQEQTEIERIAKDFLSLQKDFPEYKAFTDVPTEIVSIAQREGIPLIDAKLRYDYRQNQKAKAAQESAQKAKEASAGSAQNNDDNKNGGAFDALMRGIWGYR